jgi:hypothetical protein
VSLCRSNVFIVESNEYVVTATVILIGVLS